MATELVPAELLPGRGEIDRRFEDRVFSKQASQAPAAVVANENRMAPDAVRLQPSVDDGNGKALLHELVVQLERKGRVTNRDYDGVERAETIEILAERLVGAHGESSHVQPRNVGFQLTLEPCDLGTRLPAHTPQYVSESL